MDLIIIELLYSFLYSFLYSLFNLLIITWLAILLWWYWRKIKNFKLIIIFLKIPNSFKKKKKKKKLKKLLYKKKKDLIKLLIIIKFNYNK